MMTAFGALSAIALLPQKKTPSRQGGTRRRKKAMCEPRWLAEARWLMSLPASRTALKGRYYYSVRDALRKRESGETHIPTHPTCKVRRARHSARGARARVAEKGRSFETVGVWQSSRLDRSILFFDGHRHESKSAGLLSGDLRRKTHSGELWPAQNRAEWTTLESTRRLLAPTVVPLDAVLRRSAYRKIPLDRIMCREPLGDRAYATVGPTIRQTDSPTVSMSPSGHSRPTPGNAMFGRRRSRTACPARRGV
jgi:hypothetical protein